MRQFLPVKSGLGPLALYKYRILPTLAVFAVMMILVKFDHLYQASKVLFIKEVQAEKLPVAEPTQKQTEVSIPPKAQSKVEPIASPIEQTIVVPDDGEFDLLNLTPSKIEVLRTLAKRHQELIERESSIAQREATLSAIEKRLELKLDNLSKIQDYLETLLQQKQEKEMEATKRLVNVYEKMKPAVAANILQGIDLETLLNIMEQMKEAKASAVLAKMEPLRARILTMELAQRRKKKEEEFQEQFADQALKDQRANELSKNGSPNHKKKA